MSVSDQEGEVGHEVEIQSKQAVGENHAQAQLTLMRDSSLSPSPLSSEGDNENQANTMSNQKNPTSVIEGSRHPTVELDDAAVRLITKNSHPYPLDLTYILFLVRAHVWLLFRNIFTFSFQSRVCSRGGHYSTITS